MADAGAPAAPHGREMTMELIMAGVKMQRWKDEPMKKYLKRITHLHLNERGIGAISHLESFANLRVLYLYGNRLRHLAGLEAAATLEQLHVQRNELESLAGIEHCTGLTKLFAEGNRLSRVAGLEGIRRMEQLHLGGQRLPPGEALAFDPASLEALAPTLRVLDVAGCNVREVEQLGSLHALEELQLARNPVEELTEVAVMLRGLPRLQSLDVSECPVMAGPKNREKIIMLTERLTMLDGKEVDQKQRSFLLRLEMQKAKRRGGGRGGRGRGGGSAGRGAGIAGGASGRALGPVPQNSGRPMPFEGDSTAFAPPQRGR